MHHGHPRIKHAAGIVTALTGAAGVILLPASAQASTWQHLHHLHHIRVVASTTGAPTTLTNAGTFSYTGVENLWESAGGPAWAAPQAAQIAECESGGQPAVQNPSGATGIFQILGSVVPGNLDDPYVNALNAVAKFKASGNTFSAWVCQ